jgi:predicted PurR-regulated permease PerM
VICLGIVVLFITPHLLPSILVALVSYYFLSPLVVILQKFGLSWFRAAQLVFFAIGVLILILSFILIPMLWDEGRELIRLIPEISRIALATLKYQIETIEKQIGYTLPMNWTSYLQPYLIKATGYLAQNLPAWISQSLVLCFLAPLFTYFFLTESARWPQKLIRNFPEEWWEPVENLLQDIHLHIGGFIRARLFESIVIGGLTWGALSLIGLPFGFFLGFLAGALNIIPYVGPVLASVPAIILALSTDSPQSSLILTILTYIVIQGFDAFVIVPFFVARLVDLHSLVVIIAILLGGYLMGLVGMIISIPIAGMLKILLFHVLKWLEEKMS